MIYNIDEPRYNIKKFLEVKPMSSYPQSVLKNIKLLSFSRNKLAQPFGSFIYRVQQYPGDIDLVEEFTECCSLNEVISKFIIALHRVVNNIQNEKYHYFSEFKAGIDDRYDIDIGNMTNGIYRPSNGLYDRVNNMFNNKLLNIEEHKILTYILTQNTSFGEDEFDTITYIFRERKILRWTADEIFNNFKMLPLNKKMTLKEALSYKGHVKIDAIAVVNDRLVEITNFFQLAYVQEKDGEPHFINIDLAVNHNIPTMLPIEIEKLYFSNMFYSPFKMVKRLYSLARNTKNEDLLSRILPYISSSTSSIYQMKSEIDAMIIVIEKISDYPKNKIYNELDEMKLRLTNILEFTNNDLEHINSLINDIISVQNRSDKIILLKKLKKLIIYYINMQTIKYLQSVGLNPPPYKYLPPHHTYNVNNVRNPRSNPDSPYINPENPYDKYKKITGGSYGGVGKKKSSWWASYLKKYRRRNNGEDPVITYDRFKEIVEDYDEYNYDEIQADIEDILSELYDEYAEEDKLTELTYDDIYPKEIIPYQDDNEIYFDTDMGNSDVFKQFINDYRSDYKNINYDKLYRQYLSQNVKPRIDNAQNITPKNMVKYETPKNMVRYIPPNINTRFDNVQDITPRNTTRYISPNVIITDIDDILQKDEVISPPPFNPPPPPPPAFNPPPPPPPMKASIKDLDTHMASEIVNHNPSSVKKIKPLPPIPSKPIKKVQRKCKPLPPTPCKQRKCKPLPPTPCKQRKCAKPKNETEKQFYRRLLNKNVNNREKYEKMFVDHLLDMRSNNSVNIGPQPINTVQNLEQPVVTQQPQNVQVYTKPLQNIPTVRQQQQNIPLSQQQPLNIIQNLDQPASAKPAFVPPPPPPGPPSQPLEEADEKPKPPPKKQIAAPAGPTVSLGEIKESLGKLKKTETVVRVFDPNEVVPPGLTPRTDLPPRKKFPTVKVIEKGSGSGSGSSGGYSYMFDLPRYTNQLLNIPNLEFDKTNMPPYTNGSMVHDYYDNGLRNVNHSVFIRDAPLVIDGRIVANGSGCDACRLDMFRKRF